MSLRHYLPYGVPTVLPTVWPVDHPLPGYFRKTFIVFMSVGHVKRTNQWQKSSSFAFRRLLPKIIDFCRTNLWPKSSTFAFCLVDRIVRRSLSSSVLLSSLELSDT